MIERFLSGLSYTNMQMKTYRLDHGSLVWKSITLMRGICVVELHQVCFLIFHNSFIHACLLLSPDCEFKLHRLWVERAGGQCLCCLFWLELQWHMQVCREDQGCTCSLWWRRLSRLECSYLANAILGRKYVAYMVRSYDCSSEFWWDSGSCPVECNMEWHKIGCCWFDETWLGELTTYVA